jgi:hypothetical protein
MVDRLPSHFHSGRVISLNSTFAASLSQSRTVETEAIQHEVQDFRCKITRINRLSRARLQPLT